MDTAYDNGFEDGIQVALDVANRVADWLQANPGHKLDIFDVLARIITDIQAHPINFIGNVK